MNSKKVAAILLTGLMLTASGAALSINIELFDFGGSDDSASNNSTNSTDNGGGDDQRFSYGGEDSDQITDDPGVEKGLAEQIVGAVVNALFG